MRIIAGRYRGHQLGRISGTDMRPTSDRVREALFSILDQRPKGAEVLDLFCGSGALGLEALSRGASYGVFVDSSMPSLATLNRNLERIGVKTIKVLKGRVDRVLPRLAEENRQFDLIFLDPPYRQGLVGSTLRHLDTLNLTAPGGMIVTEHEIQMKSPPQVGSLFRVDQRRYGDTGLTMYSPLGGMET
jgi:16S rRNA (guanine966-N2)-methyltransferase